GPGRAADVVGERTDEARVLEGRAPHLVYPYRLRAAGQRQCPRHRRPPSSVGRPSASGQPSATLRFCTAWPAAPFTRLSSAEKTTARPGAAAWTDIRQSLVPTTSERRGGALSTFTNGEPA